MRVSSGDNGHTRVAVIGAGLSGVAMAVHLERRGIDFTVLERAEGAGGVWWHNTYPGAEVDVPSLIYSYSFMPYSWQVSHAPQIELQRYVNHVIDSRGMREHFVFGCGVQSVHWIDDDQQYELTRDDATIERYDVVVSCLGMLSNPRLPDWPGMDEFEGKLFHTARWPKDVDLSGATVALVGTGSTACQIAPSIAGQVAHLDVYQREPGWVMPKDVVPIAPELQDQQVRRPALWKAQRYRAFYNSYRRRGIYSSQSDIHKQTEARALAYIAATVDDPVTRAALTPSYPYGCKRPVYASGYYETFNRPNVELVPHAVVHLSPTGVVAADGVERPADVVIMATGFQATRYQATLDVRGRNGIDLQDAWKGEPRAFVGITVPDFPNFFMLYGPNTNGAMSIISTLERQAEAIGAAVGRIARRPGTVLDTKRQALERYDDWIQRRMRARDVETSGCHNYYHVATGKNVTQLPMSAPMYYVATRVLPHLGWTMRRPDRGPRRALVRTPGGADRGSRR
jgi:cation diffusion facilitator CzcD-associated flavoprotein CzcO